MEAAAAPTEWIDIATATHRRLLGDLDRLVAAGTLEQSAPSCLPGWTLGHVITHVTHSADGHVRMLDAAARGNVGVQYPGGVDGRIAGIEAGAPRPAAEQVDDLRRSCAALEDRWSTMPNWEGHGGTVRFQVQVVDLPFLRIREAAIHHVDLGIGFEFDDLPPAYVAEELRRMGLLWTERQASDVASLPAAALDLEPTTRLAWLLGRTTIDGLDAAGVY
jgi:maleylpyruvate isomerase